MPATENRLTAADLAEFERAARSTFASPSLDDAGELDVIEGALRQTRDWRISLRDLRRVEVLALAEVAGRLLAERAPMTDQERWDTARAARLAA